MGLFRILAATTAVAVCTLAASQAAAVDPPRPPAPGTSQLFPGAPLPAPVGPPVIYTVEQLAVVELTPDLQQALRPIHSLEQAEETLKVRGVTFSWRRVEVPSAGLPPQLAGQLAALPPHEVFVLTQPKGAIIGSIVQQRPAPAGVPPQPQPPPAH